MLAPEKYQDEGEIYNRVKLLKDIYNFTKFPTFEDLSGDLESELGAEKLPFLDRKNIDEALLTPDQKYWRQNGYIIFKNIIPTELIDQYIALRNSANLGPQAWPGLVPYDSFNEIKNISLYGPMIAKLHEILGYQIALYFNLSAFRSSERGWHQDDYMCDPHIAASGVAAWFALDDIHPDAGPFEFIPGSHRWPTMRKEKVLRYLVPAAAKTPNRKYSYWGLLAETYVNPACDAFIAKMGAKPQRFYAKKGDVLFWHSALMHRGSHPKNPELLRPAIIGHYCDPARMTVPGARLKTYASGGKYFNFPALSKINVVNGKVEVDKPTPVQLARRALARLQRL